MKHIIVPTDFSDRADNAANYAAALAKQMGATLVLAHGYRMPHADATMVERTGSTMEGRPSEDLDEMVEIIGNREGNEDLNIKSFHVYATVSELLEEAIEKFEPELVVMGTKGSGGLNSIFGSNTAAAILDVRCPILVVPEDATYTDPKNILFATDYQLTSKQETLKPLAQIAGRFESKVNVLTVNREEDYEAFNEALKHLETEYQDSVGASEYEQHHIHDLTVEEGIEDFIKGHDIDMLVMVTHDRGLFSRIMNHSHTKRMALHTEIPMLALHEPE